MFWSDSIVFAISSIQSSLYECMKSIPCFYCLFGFGGLHSRYLYLCIYCIQGKAGRQVDSIR